MDGTVKKKKSALYFSVSLLGLGFVSLGAPDLAVLQLCAPPPGRPLPGPAPAFVSACHLPGSPAQRSREEHKARAQSCTRILLHTCPGLQGTAPRGAGVPGESGSRSCWGDHRNYSLLAHSAPLTDRADFRGETTPRLAHSSFTPCDIRPCAPPPKRGHGVEEANANPDPDPDPERQPIKGSKTPVRVRPGVGRDRPEAPRTHPQEGGWED